MNNPNQGIPPREARALCVLTVIDKKVRKGKAFLPTNIAGDPALSGINEVDIYEAIDDLERAGWLKISASGNRRIKIITAVTHAGQVALGNFRPQTAPVEVSVPGLETRLDVLLAQLSVLAEETTDPKTKSKLLALATELKLLLSNSAAGTVGGVAATAISAAIT